MANIAIKQMQRDDQGDWAQMRYALWPNESYDEHLRDAGNILTSSDEWAFIARTDDFAPVGLAEVAVRKYANGCTERPVAFLEGIWVAPDFRRQYVGKKLLTHIGAFLTQRGYLEICSDTEIENTSSITAHRGWGFIETERVVYFRKPL
ncbi:MAG: GNAT family N-acetyltransferase [Rhodospirillaceae bacterium]|nr:GNAT family N-acetyltransferase [Rhodospirillaceae bacterium]